jgi:hypothetical protein
VVLAIMEPLARRSIPNHVVGVAISRVLLTTGSLPTLPLCRMLAGERHDLRLIRGVFYIENER